MEEWFRPTASTGSAVTVTWMGACDDRWCIISTHSNEVRFYNHRNMQTHGYISMQEFMIDTASYNELLICSCINTCTHIVGIIAMWISACITFVTVSAKTLHVSVQILAYCSKFEIS